MLRKILGPGLSLILFAAAIWLLHKELRTYHPSDILPAFDAVPGAYLWAGAGLTVLSYAVMTGYDVLAMRYLRHPLAYSKIGLASFIGYAFINNIGMSLKVVGLDLRFLLVFAGAAGIGLGLQHLAGNIISGFTIIFGGKIRTGDWIEVEKCWA